MTTSTTLGRRIRRSGSRMLLLVRLVLAVLLAAPVVALALMGVDDWHHVGPRAVAGVSTSTHCRFDEFGDPTVCFGDFSSDDGAMVLHDVEVRLEQELGHTGPATAAPSGGSWVASGESRWRMVPLVVRQVASTSAVWLLAYGVTIMGLISLVVLWTARQVGRTLASVDPGPELRTALESLATLPVTRSETRADPGPRPTDDLRP
jgi:hypothetical protein